MIWIKQVENRGHEKLVEKVAGEAKGVESIIFKKKYTPCRFGSNFNNTTNCEFSNTKITLLGPLYYSLSLFRRLTQVLLAKLKICNGLEVLNNQLSPIQVILKIIAQNMKATLNKTEIFWKVASYSYNIFWLICYMNFTIWGYFDIIQDMIL